METSCIMMEASSRATVMPVFLDDEGTDVLAKVRAACADSGRPEAARWLSALSAVQNITGWRPDQTGG